MRKTLKYLASGFLTFVTATNFGAVLPVMAQTATSSVASETPVRRLPIIVEINPAGRTLLRGTVESVASDSLTVKSWGGSWTVNVSSKTEVYPRITGTNDLSKIQAGDFVGVTGETVADQTLTVNAKLVRDWTEKKIEVKTSKEIRKIEKQARKENAGKIFVGKASAVSTDSLTLTVAENTYTVNVSADTKIINRAWRKISLSDISSGDSVRVFGVYNDNVITAKAVRDISLPKSR